MINIEKYIHKTVGGDEKIQDFSHINSEIYKKIQENVHLGIVELAKVDSTLYDIYMIVEKDKVRVISKEIEEKISESSMEFVENGLSKLTTVIFPAALLLKFDVQDNYRIFFENLGTLNHYVGFWLLEQKVRN